MKLEYKENIIDRYQSTFLEPNYSINSFISVHNFLDDCPPMELSIAIEIFFFFF